MSRNFFNNFRPIARDRTRDRLVVYIGTGLNLSKKLLVSEPLGTILLSLMRGTDKVRDTEKQRSFCRAGKKTVGRSPGSTIGYHTETLLQSSKK